MSSDEMQTNGFGVNGSHHAAGPPDVTIKFTGSDLTIQGHKSALVAGSGFFSEHFLSHPSSKKVQAPKGICPGANIDFDIVQTAINYLHGSDIPEKHIAQNSVPLLLAAKSFGILALEDRVKQHLTQKLDRQVERIATEIQIIELVPALRELYGRLGGERDVELGKEVAGIVTGAAAHACCRRFPVLKKSPEFMALLKEVPVMAYDMLASDVEVVVAVTSNGNSIAESGEDVKMGEGVEEVVTEVVEEIVTEVVEEVTEEVVEETIEETIEEVVEEVVQPVEE